MLNNENVMELLTGRFTPDHMKNRTLMPNCDELVIRKAKVHKILGPKDDRLQVQVLPELAGIPDEEKDNLPKYPPLFAGTYNPVDEGSLVLVVCTPDCMQGYILGEPQIFSDTPKYVQGTAYDYKKIKQYLQQRQACPNDFEYEDIAIVTCTMSDRGGIVEGYNKKTGDWFLMNSAGAVITVQQDKIYFRVGTPPNPISAGPAGFSSIKMTTDTTEIKTPNFVVDAQTLTLGHHGMKLAGMVTETPCIGKNLVPVEAISNISV